MLKLLKKSKGLKSRRIELNKFDIKNIEGPSSEQMKRSGHVGLDDFYEFARRLRIPDKRRDKLLEIFLIRQTSVETFIQRSFLNDQTKRAFLLHYETRRNQLNTR